MAGRPTSAGVGVVVFITILLILTVTFFVLTLVFYGSMSRAEQELVAERQTSGEYIKPEERQDERVRTYASLARQEGGLSALGFLMQEKRGAMELIGVNPDMTLEQLRSELSERKIPAGSLINALQQRERTIADLNQRLASANSRVEAAQQDALSAETRISALDEQFRTAADQLRGEVETQAETVAAYRTQVNETEQQLASRLADRMGQFQQQENALLDQVRDLRDQLAIAQDQLSRLKGEQTGTISGRAEEALVDASIVGLNPTAGEVFLDIGKRNNVPLGLRFSVYGSATQIRPNIETGEYPAGKGVVEVIRIEDSTVRARIIEENRGNPIVRGDVVANAVYDPNKTYRFLVYGNFDVNADGRATPNEANQISALISEWGGVVTNEIDGGLDFLVLGQKPNLPPAPPAGAPYEVLQEYIRLQGVASRYDELFETARRTSIPILNENRLRTLIGGFGN